MTTDPLTPINLAVIDDHQAIVSAVISTLSAALPIRQIMTSSHATDILAGNVHFDLVVLDVELNDGSSGPENVRALTGRGWPVLLYTQETSTVRVGRCLQAGARGVVAKSEPLEALVGPARLVAMGEDYDDPAWAAALRRDAALTPHLTPRETEVLKLRATGMETAKVARLMGLKEGTVHAHIRRIRDKYHALNRPAEDVVGLHVRAIEDGLLPPTRPR